MDNKPLSSKDAESDKHVRQAFGREVSRIRRNAELTQGSLARSLGVSPSQLSKIENGARGPTPRLLKGLEKSLGSNGRLQHLWQELTGSGRRAWLHEFQTQIERSAATYDYHVLAFPGYLQTKAYAQAIIRCGAPWLTPNEVAQAVEDRVARAEYMRDVSTPILWLVVDGSVLQRRYGPPHVMREQLAYIVGEAERGRVNLQLVATDTPRHPGNSGAFTVLTGDGPDVVHAEIVHTGQFVTAPPDVARYRMLFGALQGAAIAPDATLEAFRAEMKRLEDE